MAVTDKSIIKNWFKNGLIPFQEHFWNWIDSFRHMNDKIPLADVEGIDDALNSKASATVLNQHITANDAHQALFELKQSLIEKGQANGYVPLNEIIKISSQFLDIVDDLITGGSTALASAETVKTLKGQIDAINLILTSDDVNLDTVQELVDAIKEVETSLQTILVNDLTTGGTTKALTAEMGKSLKALIDALGTNKVDKVAGERLISAAEQLQLSNLSIDLSGKQDIANQIEVNVSQNAQASWHGKTVFFTANVTITIPAAGLPTGYTFEGVTPPSCSVTWAIIAPKVWALGSPAATPEKSIFTLMQLMSNSNNIYLFGL